MTRSESIYLASVSSVFNLKENLVFFHIECYYYDIKGKHPLQKVDAPEIGVFVLTDTAYPVVQTG